MSNQKAEASMADSLWNAIHADLMQTKEDLYKEICSYPAPVAGCDEQFNYLLEQRSRIQQEVARLNRYIAKRDAECGAVSCQTLFAVEEFVTSSEYVSVAIKDLVSRRLARSQEGNRGNA